MVERNLNTDTMIMIDGTRELELNAKGRDDLEKKLNKLRDKVYYENVFTWDMKKVSKNTNEAILEFKSMDELNRIMEKQSNMQTFENGLEVFRLHRFYMRLIICYELYTNGKLDESLIEIKNIVKYMENVTFNKSDEKYTAAYNHILYSTYGFIITSMNLNNFEEAMKNVKLQSELNDTEKSAIHAVKALIFMRYPSVGKHIAFQEADEACKLDFEVAEWINIWLTAKGRLNREYNNFKEPDDDEIKFSEHLYNISQTYFHLMTVNSVFSKVFRYTRDRNKKKVYYELAFKTLMKAIEMAGKDEHLIFKSIQIAINQQDLLIPHTIIEEKIQILQNVKHPHINLILGNYYLKKKEFNEATKYFTLGMESDVVCVLRLLYLECISKPLDDVAFIETLMNSYKVFHFDIDRVKLLSQVLLYYTYHEENQEKMLQYLKLFMDQPFDNAFKYRHLNSVVPSFRIKHFNRHLFVDDINNKVKRIVINREWNTEEKIIVEDTIQRFSKMATDADPKKVYNSWRHKNKQ